MDNSAINDLVLQEAEKIKQQNNNGENSSQNNNQGGNQDQGKGEPSEEEKAKLEQATKLKEDSEKLQSETLQNLYKELGVESLDDIKEALAKKDVKPLSKEEKEKADAIYNAKLQQFAVESGDMKLEDFHQLETVKAKEDAELLFEKYLKDWKEENTTVKEDIDKAAREDFEAEYKLNSENEKTKARGVARMQKDASEMRNPLESSYKSVKEKFDTRNEIAESYPKFKERIDKISSVLAPEKKEFFSFKEQGKEEELKIEVPLSDVDRKEISTKVTERLEKPDIYKLYREGKIEDIKKIAEEFSDDLIEKKIAGEGKKMIAEKFLALGTAKGSTTGATNSFATQQSKATAHEKDTKTQAEKEADILKQFGKK